MRFIVQLHVFTWALCAIPVRFCDLGIGAVGPDIDAEVTHPGSDGMTFLSAWIREWPQRFRYDVALGSNTIRLLLSKNIKIKLDLEGMHYLGMMWCPSGCSLKFCASAYSGRHRLIANFSLLVATNVC